MPAILTNVSVVKITVPTSEVDRVTGGAKSLRTRTVVAGARWAPQSVTLTQWTSVEETRSLFVDSLSVII